MVWYIFIFNQANNNPYTKNPMNVQDFSQSVFIDCNECPLLALKKQFGQKVICFKLPLLKHTKV